MYPKVRVTQQEDDDDRYAYVTSTDVFPSPVINCEDDSFTPTVRIPEASISRSALPSVTVSKGVVENNQKATEENKQNIRAGPILPPRAVMSSPDNDEIVGNKNRAKAELLPGIKNSNKCLSRHAQCKVPQKPVVGKSHVNSRSQSAAYGTNTPKVKPSLTREWIS